jgi:hypothetical protein
MPTAYWNASPQSSRDAEYSGNATGLRNRRGRWLIYTDQPTALADAAVTLR